MRRMQRSGGITVIAVFALFGSLACVAMGCLMGLALLFGRNHQTIDPATAPFARIGMIIAIVFFIGPAMWGIASAIGLFRLRRWARISTLIFAGILIFFGIVSPLFVLAMPTLPTPGIDPTVMAGVKIAISGFYLLLAAVGGWWMIYLTRPRVIAQFQAGAAVVEESRRPLSISIIAWVLIVGTCFVPISMALRFPLLLFGGVFTGWQANMILLAFAAVGITAGVGLLRLRPSGWLLALGYLIFGCANALTTWLLPGSAARIARMMEAMPTYMRTQPAPAMNPIPMALASVPVLLVPLYFLLKHKAAFYEPGQLPPPPPAV
jgi:hypothetical protein